ncbi:lysophospholipid acyltransferase family protein [Tuberibacillus sp. Marseille-P3662]|uniref:lysophospholipid acyltransferase family protein n=1 Tax=Tuberibacillus sp. Marseille-P3662 TaxID=1965358 RepID=UPI000A1CBEF0|nr:lysophospholipid acyltransferase family protein [Tuberibacillus sp. Marseille-P3662]
MKLYSFGQWVARNYFNTLYRISVTGEEHIPDNGSLLVCSNHISNLDPPLIASFLRKRELSFMAKEELFKVPGFNRLITSLNAFPIKRGKGDRQAIRKSVEVLNEGRALLMFPEGNRNKSDDRSLGTAQTGAGYFALRTQAQVVPCAVIGNYKFGHEVRLKFGPTIDFSNMREQKAKPKEAVQVIMEHIQLLITQTE